MKAVLLVLAAGGVPGMRGYYPSPVLGDDGVLFGVGYQPFVYVSDLVDQGEGWMAQFGWGMGGRAAAVIVAYEESRHRTLDTGKAATYWRLDAGYGAYITEFPRKVAPYLSCGVSLHSIGWGSGPDEGRGGYGGYIGMGVDFLPSTHVFFGFDFVCHLWAEEAKEGESTVQGYATITATVSAFVEF